MSEETTNTATITDKPRKSRATSHVAFGSIHVRTAKTRGVDVTKAAKLNRSYIRSNFDDIVRLWPELAKAQKVNRDGNRYPATIPAKVADMIVARNVPTKARARASK